MWGAVKVHGARRSGNSVRRSPMRISAAEVRTAATQTVLQFGSATNRVRDYTLEATGTSRRFMPTNNSDAWLPIASSVGILAALGSICAFFFWLEKATRWRLFNYLPPLVFIYVTPAALTNLGVLPAKSP